MLVPASRPGISMAKADMTPEQVCFLALDVVSHHRAGAVPDMHESQVGRMVWTAVDAPFDSVEAYGRRIGDFLRRWNGVRRDRYVMSQHPIYQMVVGGEGVEAVESAHSWQELAAAVRRLCLMRQPDVRR